MAGWQEFTGLNRGYVLELYEKVPQRSGRRSTQKRARCSSAGRRRPNPTPVPDGVPLQKVVGAVNLAQSIRRYGHLAAQLDPLGSRPARRSVARCRETHGVTDEDLRRAAGDADLRRRSPTAPPNMLEVDRRASARVYCSTTGLRLRARLRARGARSGCARRPKAGASARRPIRSTRVALLDRLTAGRSVRALPAPHLPGQDALLDRRARHARADSRRGDWRGGGGGHPHRS